MQWSDQLDHKLLACILQLYQPPLEYNALSEAMKSLGEEISRNAIGKRIRKIKRDVAAAGVLPKGDIPKKRGRKPKWLVMASEQKKKEQEDGDVDDDNEEEEEEEEKEGKRIKDEGNYDDAYVHTQGKGKIVIKKEVQEEEDEGVW